MRVINLGKEQAMKFEESIEINADAATVFDVLTNVSEWSVWDPETESASLDGDFVVGATGTIKPKGAPNTKIKLTEVTENESFTVECSLPLSKMHFIHTLSPTSNGVSFKHSLEFSGLLAPIFARLMGKSISKTLPGSVQGLKNHIETQS